MIKTSPFKPYLVVFTAALFFMFEFINMNSFNVLNDQLREAFNANALAISNLSAMYFYANVIFLIPAGLLLDRFSTKKLLLSATLLCIVSNLIFASTHHFEVAKLCRFVTGMGSTLALLSCALLTSRWLKPKQAGVAIGGAVTLAMLGGFVAQQMTWIVHFTGSWRTAIMAITGLGFIFWLLILWIVEDYPPHYAMAHQECLLLIKEKGLGHHFVSAFKNKQVWLSGSYSSLINLTVMIIGALWGQDYLMKSHGFTSVAAASAISLTFIGLMIGSPLFGLLSDRMGRRKLPMIIGGVLNLLCILMILKLQFSPLQASLLFFVLGLLSSSQVLTYPLIIESVPKHIVASSEAISATLIMGGGAVFQPLFGYLLDRFTEVPGQYSAAAFDKAMWVLPICFIVATIFALFLKETYCLEHQQPHSAGTY